MKKEKHNTMVIPFFIVDKNNNKKLKVKRNLEIYSNNIEDN